jgi:hypothetical protein
MCFACEQEQMLAAYREYMARKKALLRAKTQAGGPASEDAAPDGDDWAKGTWFAAAVPESDE